MRILLAFIMLVPRFVLAQDAPRLPRIVKNPAATFLDEYKPVERVSEIHADFDRDGIVDVAFGDRALFGHRGNGPWDILFCRPDGRYVEVGAIEYRLHLRIARGKEGATIKTYIPGGGGQGAIITYRISKLGLKQIKEEGIDLEVNGSRIEKTFGKNPSELPFKNYTNEEFLAKAST